MSSPGSRPPTGRSPFKSGALLTPSFSNAWFVVPYDGSDGAILGPFFTAECAVGAAAQDYCVVYKADWLTPRERNVMVVGAQIAQSAYLVNAGRKASWRKSKLVADSRIAGSDAFTSALLVFM